MDHNRAKITVAEYRCLASDFTAARYDPEPGPSSPRMPA